MHFDKMYYSLQLVQYNFLKVDTYTSPTGTLDQCRNDWHVTQEEQSLGKNHLSASKVPLAVAPGINLDVQRTRLYFAYLRGWTSDHLFTASPSLSFAGDSRRELKGQILSHNSSQFLGNETGINLLHVATF